jgi:hypothetical protein
VFFVPAKGLGIGLNANPFSRKPYTQRTHVVLVFLFGGLSRNIYHADYLEQKLPEVPNLDTLVDYVIIKLRLGKC